MFLIAFSASYTRSRCYSYTMKRHLASARRRLSISAFFCRKRLVSGAAVLALLVLTGCLSTSLNPLYTKADLIYDATLLGTWADKDDPDSDKWVFTKSGDLEYELTVTPKDGKTGKFETRLLKLDDTLFLDICPRESVIEKASDNETERFLLIRRHMFMKVKLARPQLRLETMQLDWLKEELAQDRSAPAWQKGDDNGIMFTASTADLQRFVRKHIQNTNAWDEFELALLPASDKADQIVR